MNNQNNQPQEELSSPEGTVALNEEQLENVQGAGGAASALKGLGNALTCCIAPKTNEGGLQMQLHYQKLEPETQALLHKPVPLPALEGAPSSSPSTTSGQKTAYAREFNPFTGSKVQPHSPTK